MKWIVFWVWVQLMIIPCPQQAPVPDEFGRYDEITSYTLQVCYEAVSHPLSKEFETKAEAEAFIERGEAESDLQDFRMERK